ERDLRQRPRVEAGKARRRGPHHPRFDGARLQAVALIVGAVEVEAVLLGLKIAFLVLLSLFIWRIVRSVAKDLRLPQESFVLGPQQAAAAGLGRPQTGLLVVLSRPALDQNTDRAHDHI